MPRLRSIRSRILAAAVLVTTLVLAGGGAATAWMFSSYLENRTVERLQGLQAQVQGVLAVRVANKAEKAVGRPQIDAVLGGNSGLILVAGQKPVYSSRLPEVPTQRLMSQALTRPGQVVMVDADPPAAVIVFPTRGLSVTLEAGGQGVDVDSVVLAVSRVEDQQTVGRLIRSGLVVGVFALALLWTLIAVVVTVGLRPLTDLADAVLAVGRGERAPDTIPTHGSTETGQVARAVREALTARARAENRLRSFVADASHELRTPLTKIGGWVDLYLQGGVRGDEATQAAMEKVELETGRMGSLVEELSLLARLDAQAPLDLAELDLAALTALTEEVVEDARVVASDRTFTLHPVPAGEQVVNGDAERLRRVLRNLVGNAAQHTPAGTAVDVSLRVRRQSVLIDVRDHGPGIPADQLPRLFERFWRAEESRTRAQGGSGLGLAIVEAVVAAHGGSVGVQSVTGAGPDQGTTVTVTLPVATSTSGTRRGH